MVPQTASELLKKVSTPNGFTFKGGCDYMPSEKELFKRPRIVWILKSNLVFSKGKSL